jgi:hypothetical protein
MVPPGSGDTLEKHIMAYLPHPLIIELIEWLSPNYQWLDLMRKIFEREGLSLILR